MAATEDLFLLAFLMLVLTLLFGLLPIKCQLGVFYNNIFATAAAGLLLGTACIVIIPEGLELLLHGLEHHDDHGDHEEDHTEEEQHHDEDHTEEEQHHEDDYGEEELNGPLFGFAILSGIVLMILVHRFGPKHTHGHGHALGPANDEDKGASEAYKSSEQNIFLIPSGDTNGEKRPLQPLEKEAAECDDEGSSANVKSEAKGTKITIHAVTMGLLVHAMFDGVALGIVTAGGEDSKVTWVVFGALMGHKAPEAISLTLVLMTRNLNTWVLFLNVLLFSISAPLMALISYVILEAGTQSSNNAGEVLGYLMLFAGGTFLGVIFEHILPELKTIEPGNWTLHQILAFVIGTVIPMTIPHDHGH